MTFDLYLPPFHHASILFLLKRANMENFFDFTKLQGDTCTIIPLSYDHHDELSEAVADGELCKLWYTFAPDPQKMQDNISLRLKLKQDGTMLPFTVVDNKTHKAIGMTTY